MFKKCIQLWHEARLEVKMLKAHHIWTAFGSYDVEKVHAVVARSTFGSQNGESTPRTTFGRSSRRLHHNRNYNYSYNYITLRNTTRHDNCNYSYN